MPVRSIGRSLALLKGLIFDDRGNRMTPVHVTKGTVRYCYYQSWVLAHGQKAMAGSVCRVPAGEIEQVVIEAVAKHVNIVSASSDGDDAFAVARDHIDKVVVHQDRLVVTLRSDDQSPELEHSDSAPQPQTLTIAWSKPSPIRKRDILRNDDSAISTRPIRSEARARLLRAIAQGRDWLDQITSGRVKDVGTLADTHQVSEKTVRSTLSLALLSPDIVQAAIDGRLPRGLSVSRMTDLPADWSMQRQQLGLG
jgi:hypothetical protein